MHLPKRCLNAFIIGGVISTLSIFSASVQAITINFSATLIESTCAFSLDKSTLDLGTLQQAQLVPSSLLAAQPFVLSVRDCNAVGNSQLPVVNVTGPGVLQDTKWLFRAASSTATNVGVMLVHTNAPPSFSDIEVKNNDDIPLADRGDAPVDQDLTFYAGLTCGIASCASVTPGTLTAPI
ncbi:fimbrial protein, partial [Candidatus Symbiopectobacterium sp. NZEC135]